MARVVSIITQKGGVGKTTSTVHIATALANRGFKVLAIDFDTSQANLTYSLIGRLDFKTQRGLCYVIGHGGVLSDAIYPTKNKNLFIAASEKYNQRGQAYNTEATILQMGGEGYHLLSDLVRDPTIDNEFDFVLIDNPPKLGAETLASLICSDYYLVPVEMSDLALSGVSDTLYAAKNAQKSMNPKLKLLGIFISIIDNRIKKNQNKAIEDLENFCISSDIKLFGTRIPQTKDFRFLANNQNTIFDISKASSRGHAEYLTLVDEILEKMKLMESRNLTVKTNHSNIQCEV